MKLILCTTNLELSKERKGSVERASGERPGNGAYNSTNFTYHSADTPLPTRPHKNGVCVAQGKNIAQLKRGLEIHYDTTVNFFEKVFGASHVVNYID